MTQALKRTALYETHVALKGRMVPFAGWEMPVQYEGILAETRAVRRGAGLFDVSHMGRLYISGPQAGELLDWILTADALNLRHGRGRYAMICNPEGGIIDDTVFYRLFGPENGTGSLENQVSKKAEADAQDDGERYLLVCNAGNHQHVLPWVRRWAKEKYPGTSITDRTEDTAMIAFQGPSTPQILELLSDSNPSSMRPFSIMEGNAASRPCFIGRTGYTGEDGFELITSAGDAPHVWNALMGQGAVPCGLGARDVLRLEAGLALHGHDIDPSTTPLEAGLDRFVRLETDFVGSEALRGQKEAGLTRRLVGLVVEGRSIAREGYPIVARKSEPPLGPELVEGRKVGHVTSGTYSPTLDTSIAMGYVLMEFASPGQRLQIDIRGRLTGAEVTQLPFYSRRRP